MTKFMTVTKSDQITCLFKTTRSISMCTAVLITTCNKKLSYCRDSARRQSLGAIRHSRSTILVLIKSPFICQH